MHEKMKVAVRNELPVVIRAYQPKDREAVREICAGVAHEQPDPLFYEDGWLAPLLLTDYYVDNHPDCCVVAEVDGRVVGYVVGCSDTAAYLRALKKRIMPRMAVRIVRNVLTLRYRRKATYQAIWWHLVAFLFPKRFETLPAPPPGYPAHSHFNVESGFRRHGIGHEISIAFNCRLLALGVTGRHGVLVERIGSERVSKEMCTKRGFRITKTIRHELLNKITGGDWELKLLLCDLKSAPVREI